jgi:hypothetical protein
LADVFEKAGRHMEREKRLLNREPEPASSSETSTPAFAPWPDCRADLIGANAQYHPATLFAGTPAAGLKKIVLRVMNVYTYRQILFNAAVVRILNRWDERLQLLSEELSGFAKRVNRHEERRSLWEARLAGQIGALEDRTSAAESDVAELESRARKERARVDSLEDSVRRLEAVLSRERETAGAETPR